MFISSNSLSKTCIKLRVMDETVFPMKTSFIKSFWALKIESNVSPLQYRLYTLHSPYIALRAKQLNIVTQIRGYTSKYRFYLRFACANFLVHIFFYFFLSLGRIKSIFYVFLGLKETTYILQEGHVRCETCDGYHV